MTREHKRGVNRAENGGEGGKTDSGGGMIDADLLPPSSDSEEESDAEAEEESVEDSSSGSDQDGEGAGEEGKENGTTAKKEG